MVNSSRRSSAQALQQGHWRTGHVSVVIRLDRLGAQGTAGHRFVPLDFARPGLVSTRGSWRRERSAKREGEALRLREWPRREKTCSVVAESALSESLNSKVTRGLALGLFSFQSCRPPLTLHRLSCSSTRQPSSSSSSSSLSPSPSASAPQRPWLCVIAIRLVVRC